MSNKVMKDDTGQAINTTLQSLVGSISPSAANVTFDNTGTDLTSSDVERAIKEVNTNHSLTLLGISSAWSGSSTAQVLPTISLSDSPFNYELLLIQLVINGVTSGSTLIATDDIYALQYINVNIYESASVNGCAYVGNFTVQSVDVRAFVSSNSSWYSVNKKVRIYGINHK